MNDDAPFQLWCYCAHPHLGLAPLLVLLFPSGRLLSRRWRLVVWLTWASIVAGLPSSDASLQVGSSTINLPNPTALSGPEAGAAVKDALQSLSGLTVLVSYAFAATAMVVRLRRARSEERQQLKWFAFASELMALVLIAESVIFFTPARRTLDPDAPYPVGLFLGVPFALALAIIPAAVGIAILKYRLYEIDIIIRRTLIYSALTGLLALIYFGSVVLLQQLFRAERQSEIVTVISTLAIAALFAPLRRRVQNAIDRGFYRRKYDAAKTLAEFGATMRDEVDLNKLTERLVAVVQETMQPESVSLWLRNAASRERGRSLSPPHQGALRRGEGWPPPTSSSAASGQAEE